MEVSNIVSKYLLDNGYDGLCNDGCGCFLDDFMPCGNCHNDCVPGYEGKFEDGDKGIFPTKDQEQKP